MKNLITLSFVLMLGTACSTVYSPEPMGSAPLHLDESGMEWAGNWIDDQGDAYLVSVTDASEGILKVSWLEEDDDNVEMKVQRMHLRKSGDWSFISMGHGDPPKHYSWARIKTEKRQVILWIPDTTGFKALVEQGKLPGSVDGDDVYLENLNAEHMELIMSGDHMLLDWETPFVFRRSD